MARADTYLQPDAPDPVLSTASVLEIAGRHTDRAVEVLAVDESGGEARVYLFTGDIVVKTQRPHRLRPRTSLAKEALILRSSAGALGDRVPELFGYGRTEAAEGAVEYLVMSRMPGEALVRRPVEGVARAMLVRDVGKLLAELHDVSTESLVGELELVPVDPDGHALRERLEAGFADLVDLLAERPQRWSFSVAPQDVAELALAMIPGSFTPVLLHSNPGLTHVFCAEDGAFTGVIDFGDSYLSHPAMDLRTWPDPADRMALREGYLEHANVGVGFEDAWAAAMIYTDMAVIASRPELEAAAQADLAVRLGAQ
ncbi:MAG: aminoglycoside phosphotransferase family protein [Nocardioidaceae bacterium]